MDVESLTESERSISPSISKSRMDNLQQRYGHIPPGAAKPNLLGYYLHLKVDQRAVNQGLCYLNLSLNTYYIKSRKSCGIGQLPKELICMELERPMIASGHTHIEFFVTGSHCILFFDTAVFR